MKKYLKLITIILCFILAFPTHFIYKLLPGTFTAIFFPINESIFEHMKILFTSILVTNMLMYYFFKGKNNVLFASFLAAFISIPLYLLFYLPVYHFFSEVLWYSIGLIFIVDVIVVNFEFWLMSFKKLHLSLVGLIGIIVTYIVFAYLSYNPLMNYLFFDPLAKKYGFNIYPV